MDPAKEKDQKVEEELPKTTDTSVRFLAYLARIRSLVAAASGATRYFAYTSDVGEAFRPIVHSRVVQGAYAVSWAYVATDVSLEAYKEHKKGGTSSEVARIAVERAIFQSVASMLLPAVTIHTTVHAFHRVFHRVGRFQKWGPTAAGLAVVPLLPYMYDHPVEFLVEKGFDFAWPTEHHKLDSGETHHKEDKPKKE